MITSNHFTDSEGRPAGGTTYGVGFAIGWQNGPLVDSETGERRAPTGAFVENVIEAVVDRIEYYQASQFANSYNAKAVHHLREALACLNARTKDREDRGVEGTHQQ